jgi:haloalkane dehalogenase
MKMLRTPEERFADLPGFDYAPHYIEDLAGYSGLRIHYVDAGPDNAEQTFLCLHGEPTWSYLYRRMIPKFVAAGGRAVAPDLPGFGRSDKPEDDAVYTFEFHRDLLLRFVERLDLKNITLVCQDWGGLLGLTLPMDLPGRFSRLLIMNTALGTGDVPLSEGFVAWRAWVAKNPAMDVAKLMGRSCPHLTPQECAAYAAPYPDARYMAGVRRFPQLVPDAPNAPGAETSRRARTWWQNQWQGRSFMAIGMKDPVLGAPVMHALRSIIPNCPEPYEHPDAGHFAQEWGDDIAQRALSSFGS